MKLTKETILEINLDRLIELKNESHGLNNLKAKNFLTKEYEEIYEQVKNMGKDMSNYPQPENLWGVQ